MIISYNNIGSIGLVEDVNPKALPADNKNGVAWSNVQNFRFKDGVVSKMPGYNLLIDTSSTITPYFTTRIANGSSSYYVYAGTNKIYCQYSLSHYNITRQSGGVDVNYSADLNNQWNVAILNGFPVFNNGIDIPQAWTTVNQSTRLSNLSNWPTSYKAAVIRSFKAYLVALDITNAVPTRDPNKVKWSAAALPAALPTSWNHADVTKDAGEITLADSDGYLVDCLQLNDFNVVYKNTSTYLMSYVGGNSVFSFKKIFPTVGMLAKNCAAYFEGKHFVVTNDDVIVHDGFTYQSVIDGKNKKYLFNNISPSASQRTFVVPNYANAEMWICYPTGSSTYPNNTLIYNYKTGAWTKRLIPETPQITAGFVDIGTSSIWDTMSSTTWTGAVGTFDNSIYSKNSWMLSMVVPSANNICLIDQHNNLTDAGNPSYGYLERQDLLNGDDSNIKLVKSIWPKVTKTGGVNNSIDIYVGGTMTPNGEPVWQGPFPFDTQTDSKINCFVTGRNISIRFSSSTDIAWSMNSFDVDVIHKGKW
jgi:hypothetical protein